jgi:hypothetical protein
MSTRKNESNKREGGIETELIARILESPMKVSIEGIDDKGDILFYVSLRHLGMTKADLTNYLRLICTRFFTDFVGELLVRYNIDDFVKYMSESIAPNQYFAMVDSTRHGGFGLFILDGEDAFRFQFHISFLQQILSEDVNHIIPPPDPIRGR